MDEALLDLASDPSDWTGEWSQLRALDESLRCGLCYDVFRAPVAIRECAHLFCSACIRMHINQAGGSGAFCPSCRQKKAYDAELVPQPALEAAADNWRTARPFLMRKRTELEELVGEHALLRAELEEVERRAKDAPSLRVPSSPGEDEPQRTGPAKREHDESVARRVKQRVRGAAASHAPVVESDEEQPNIQAVDYRELGAEDTVQCPICQRAFTTVALNEHLDRGCTPGRASPPRPASGRMDAWLGVRAPQEEFHEAKRITRPQYQLKSERDMRKMLESLGLPTAGNKDRLVERHRQWVNLFNANLDAAPAHRESVRSLRKQLSAWERSQDEAATQDKMPTSQKHYRQWLSGNKQQYSQLTAIARASAARSTGSTQASSDAPTPAEASASSDTPRSP